ncbi:MAG: M20/M25/M40 family metallo-hydrolase [Candidatus Poribacteria bacterium]
MSKYRYKIFFLLVFIFLCNSVLADEVLFTINPYDIEKIPYSSIDKWKFRFQGKDILIAQGDESSIGQIPVIKIIDKISDRSTYYFVRYVRFKPDLDGLAKILLDYNNSILIKIDPKNSIKLLNLGLKFFELPESIKLDLTKKAPRYKPISESEFDFALISDIVKAVNKSNLKQVVLDLQENKDLDPPHIPYKSRFCLRVRDTDDKSDEACDNAADYIYNKFKEYGLEAEFDTFPHEVLTQGHYKMRNVIATLPGKGKDNKKVYIISSHYDSVASKTKNWQLDWKKLPAPGADDNASATSAVLECARILSKFEFNSTIKFVTYSGEELGLHGSRYYSKKLAEANEEIAGVINLDMIGYDPDTPDIDIITNLGSEWIAEAMLYAQKRYGISSIKLNKIINPDMVYSDHAPFWQNGFNAILGIDNSNFDSPEFYPYMHTEEDTIDKLNLDLMTDTCKIAIATLASLADPIDELPHPDLAINEKDISLSPDNPLYGQAIQLKAVVRNIGDADAKGVSVQILVDEPLARSPKLIAEKTVDIATKSQAYIDANFAISEWGESKIIVKVNPDYRVFETDGRNNIAIKLIRISSNSPELGKFIIYPNPIKLEKDKKVNLEYTLSKDSSVKMEIYTITGDLVYEKDFVGGNEGGKFGINKGIKWNGTSLSGDVVTPGIYICRLVISDESNNNKSLTKKFAILR